MNPVAAHLAKVVREALHGIPAADRGDVYLVWLCPQQGYWEGVWRASLLVGYTTEAQVARKVGEGYDEQEARWNFALWRHEPLADAADAFEDPVGYALVETWFRELGAAYDEDEVDEEEEQELIDLACSSFEDLLGPLVSGLHEDGTIVEVFGRTVPVCISEPGDDRFSDTNGAANPPGLAPADNWQGLRP